MKANYPECLKFVLQQEGGYVNNPADPGGATMQGITQHTYDAYRERIGQPKRWVRRIRPDELAAIYRHEYWEAVQGDTLPSGLDLAIFDFAVNSGVARARKYAALARNDIGKLCDLRLSFLKTLKTWGTFGKGWERRVNEVRSTALGMAEKSHP